MCSDSIVQSCSYGGDKDVTAWNQERNIFAFKVHDEVINDLWEEEKKIAEK